MSSRIQYEFKSQIMSVQLREWFCFGVTLKNFIVFLGEAQPQKSRLFERGTSEFSDFGRASLRKTRPFTKLDCPEHAESYTKLKINSYHSVP